MDPKLIGISILVLSSSFLIFKRKIELQTWLENNLGGPLIDSMGYLCGALQLGAVMAVSRGWVSNKSKTYHGLSLIGSAGLLATAFYHNAMAPSLVNIIWMGMNGLGLLENITNSETLSRFTEINLI